MSIRVIRGLNPLGPGGFKVKMDAMSRDFYFQIGLYTTGGEAEIATVEYLLRDSPGFTITSETAREIEVRGDSSENRPDWKTNWLGIEYQGKADPPPPVIRLEGQSRTKGSELYESTGCLFFLVWPEGGAQ